MQSTFLVFIMVPNGFIIILLKKLKEKKERDLKIHELEEKLGLIGRDNKALYYDPHYYRNRNKNRNDYLVDLKRKVDCNYNSPDIITIIVESTFDSSIFDEDSECSTLIMVHEDYYNVPKKRKIGEPTFILALMF